MKKALLTVNIITYNHVKYIEECIKSILAQKTNFKFIIRIFDDCSTDGTTEICEKYANKYPKKIQLYKADHNLGVKRGVYVNALRSYENIKKLDEFYTLYNSLIPTEWQEVTNNTIYQPEDSAEGEEYVVWLKGTNAEGEEIVDVQFMTCTREEEKEYVPEVIEQKTTVKLPVTFDTTITLLIVLGVIIVAIVVLVIVKKKLSKKDNK